jgi:hypothetical protein
MAIKIQGSTIIDDSRKVINASHVGIGTTNPTVELDVDGQANISGIVTASSFVKSSNSGGFLKADGTEDTSTYLTSYTETNDLSSAVTWANVPDANITETSVTQHQAALSITESQISDLQSYLTTESQTLDDVVGLGSDTTQTITVGTATTGVVVRPDGTLKASGIVTASKYVVQGGSSTGFLKADGSIDSSPYATGTGTLDSIVIKDNSQNVGSASTFTSIDFYNGIGVSTTGVVGVASVRLEDNISISGIFTAASFVKSSNSGGFLKADGTEDTNTYNNYSHPNHSGDVTSTGDGATVIANNAVTHAKYQQVASGTIIGRLDPNTGNVTALSKASVLTILNVEDGADVTDATNVANAGAVMDSDFTSNGFMKRTGAGTYTVDNNTYLTTESQTLDDVVGLGSTTSQTISVGNLNVTGTGNTSTITGAANLVLDPAAVGDNTGKVIIFGNLQVDGTTTEINSTTLTIDDKSIVVASGATDSASANGAGIEVDGANATFQYAHTGTKWVANKTIEATSFIKNGGASTEFLKADGSVDTNTYLTSFSESDTLDSVTTRGSTTTNNVGVGTITATKFVKSGGQSTEFLKADGSVDSNTYLTSFSESDTLDSVTTRGSTTTNNVGVGTITATKFVKSGGQSTEFLKADGSVDSNTYLTSLGTAILDGDFTSNGFMKRTGAGTYTVDNNTYLTTESQTLDDVVGLGSATTQTITVGTATTGVVVRPNGTLDISGTVGIGTRIDIIPYDTQNNGTLSFEGSAGQLFSISNNLTTGSIFSVNDVSGIPSIDVDADGTIQLAPFSATEFVGIGTTNPTAKLHVNGTVALGSSVYDTNGTFGTNGQVLSNVTGFGVSWTTVSGGGSGIASVAADTTPQLGGNLNTNGNNIEFGDDDFAIFGASNDLSIYHAVSTTVDHVNETYLTAQNGGLNLEANSGGHVRIKGPYQSGTLAKFNAGGSAELYHNGNKKLETTGTGVSFTDNIENYNTLVGSGSTTVVEFAVTVAAKSDHRYTGGVNGASTSGYYLDGIESPFLTLTPGRTYKFDQSDSSNNSHPLRFYLEANKTTQYSTNVTTNGTAGQAGAYTQIVVTDTTPTVLHYQCSAHAYMGNAVFTNSNASSITGITTDAQGNTYAGELAGGSFSGTSAQYNTLFGYDAGGDITTGDFNTCIGWTAGDKITEGTKNVALGAEALDFCTTGSNNVAVGWEAGRSLVGGTYNVMVGDTAGRTASSWTRTIAIGPAAASNHGTITDGIAIGNNALRNGGNYSIAIGYRAAYSQRNSEYSVYIGHQSGGVYTGTNPWGSGNENVAIGRNSLGIIKDGADNTVLGANAGAALTSGSNNILIGHDAAASSPSASNEVVIGDLNITKFSIPGIGVTLKDNGGTPTQGHVLTVDANGEASFAAASGGGSSVWSTSGNDAYYTTGNIGIGTASPVSDLDVRGLVTIQNLSGNNYNENLRLGRSNGGYSSIAFAANVANTSGTVAGQFTHLVYPSNTNLGDFAIRANTTDALRITTGGTPQLFNAGDKKFETRTDGISVAGIVTAISGVVTYYGDASNLTNTTNASSGTYGSSTEAAQISVDSQGRITSITNVSIVSASNATPTIRTTHNFTTTDGQTLFPPTGTIGFTSSYVDVFYNGVRLEAAEYTENVTGSSGTSITLTTPAGLNDIVDIVAYESIGISTVNLLGDTTPQLGGDLDLNGFDITGTGSMNITGIATANGGQLQTEADVIGLVLALG